MQPGPQMTHTHSVGTGSQQTPAHRTGHALLLCHSHRILPLNMYVIPLPGHRLLCKLHVRNTVDIAMWSTGLWFCFTGSRCQFSFNLMFLKYVKQWAILHQNGFLNNHFHPLSPHNSVIGKWHLENNLPLVDDTFIAKYRQWKSLSF